MQPIPLQQPRNDAPMTDARIQQLVLAAASQLVSHPSDLDVQAAVSIKTVTVSISGNRADTGALMGKECRNLAALEAIVRQVAHPREARISIAEGHCGAPGQRTDIPLRAHWGEREDELLRQAVSKLVQAVVEDAPHEITIKSVAMDTVVTICVDCANPALESAFQVVFRAWGRRHGRRVRVDMGTFDECRAA
jgi:predicted RNA-binding protein YlqC (UPF0109 family)